MSTGAPPAVDGGTEARPHWRLARAAVLVAVFVCAACGLVYELALVALGSYLIGDAVGQASIVLGVMVFAMGVGALVAKPLQPRAAAAFAVIELTLALLGGLSVLGLYAAFAWLDLYGPALVGTAFVLGLLIGAEIPLLMVMLQRIREQAAGSAVADLFAADYVGALLGGLAFPFLLIPVFGQLKGALVVGAVNAVAGLALVCTVFRKELSRRARLVLGAGSVVVALCLGYAWVTAADFEVTARQQLYRDPVVHAERSRYQEIVLTRSVREVGHADTDLRLFLNGDLQFSSVDEYRYHEALVHPAMRGPRGDVLVLGAGDGLAVREILRYPDVRRVTVVDLDPAVVALASTVPQLRELNGGSLDDPRVRVLNTDAFGWLRTAAERFDVVVADLPDPDETATAKLYTVEFYTLIRSVLAEQGRLVVQSGSPYFAPRSYWSIDASVREAGFATVPYHVDVPSFGDWGFLLATAGTVPPVLELPADAPRLRFLDPGVLRAAAAFPPDRARLDVPPSTLLQPRVLDYARTEWRGY
ncbi:polyamine aminopropyltransferase [Micromonospora ureilytica]|uniref:Polyamine aminopropyltransferase n=1 Tax=Micromonospora ureilytica TaxID=709868 RepID=A0A3N9Y383_9ACTN|nr:polyamine aminopropyltransferase [Micromonospora ureilytica]RQX19748.1 polyamine aminopropyltransferase [Micromonospora ureilytica]